LEEGANIKFQGSISTLKLTLSSTLESLLGFNTITFLEYAHKMQDKIKTRRQVIIPLKGWSTSDILEKP